MVEMRIMRKKIEFIKREYRVPLSTPEDGAEYGIDPPKTKKTVLNMDLTVKMAHQIKLVGPFETFSFESTTGDHVTLPHLVDIRSHCAYLQYDKAMLDYVSNSEIS